ncbi:MAG: tetratricopeptide repeat protein [Chitinophagaceae bacterium]
MRKELFYYLVVVWITLFNAPVKGYTQKDKNRQDSVIVFRMLETAESLFKKNNYDSAIFVSRQAISYSLQHNYLYGHAWAAVKINDILIVKDELTEAEKNTLVVYRLAMQLKDSQVMAISFLHKAQIQLYQDKYDSAIINFEKSLNYYLEKVRNSYTALAYNDLGYTWGSKEDIEKMVSYCLKSLSIYETLNDPTGCAMALGNISTVYYGLGQRDKAIEYAKKSLTYREQAGDINKLALACCNISQYYLGNDIDEAVKYQQLCVKYAEQSGSEDRLIHSYITSSLVANAQKKNQEAFEYELKVIDLLENSRSDLIMLSRRYIAAAFLADMLKKDSTITLSYFNKSMQLSKEINSKTNQRDLFLFMSNFYIRKNNFEEAYKNYKKHILYRDSISSIEKQQNIDELEKKYQTAKKDVEIERLSSKQRINQLEIEKQQAIINGNKLEAMQKTNAISILQQQQQLQNLRLSTQEEELQKQKLQTQNKDQELALVQKEQLLNERRLENQQQLRNSIIVGTMLLLLLGSIGFSRYQLKKKLEQQTVMQEMRNHIASDLHDDIGASLSNINILNELTRRNAANPQKVKEYLNKASEDIRQVSEGISDIVWNINPRYDDLAHLFVRMKRYASDILDGKNIEYTIQFPEQAPDWKLGMDKRRDLYLLFKEAVNNLAKYSNATMAIIELWLENGRVRLSINDNGVGFEASSLKVGNGLQNMQDRAVLLKGNLSINSSPGKGTQLLLDMSM